MKSNPSVIRFLICVLALTGCAPHGADPEVGAADAFVASRAGEVYYPRSCSVWERIPEGNRIGFESEEAARSAGYRLTTNRACADRMGEDDARLRAREGCTVLDVSDGDTLSCSDGRRIRLLLVDAPELSQGIAGRLAREALREMLPPGSAATLELDVRATDRYGRTLAYVYARDGTFVNEEMARRGFATRLVYPPNVRYVERIERAVREAREAGRGLWSDATLECAPIRHRRGEC